MSDDIYNLLRGLVRRVTLRNVRDDGHVQTADVEVADGIWREGVELPQTYGQAGRVPEDGAIGIALAIGGDQGDIAVISVGNPSKRLANIPAGGSGSYNEHGDRVLILPDGTVEIAAATALDVTIGTVNFRVSSAGVDISGGYVRHNGVNIGATHKHSGVTPGGSQTGTPG